MRRHFQEGKYYTHRNMLDTMIHVLMVNASDSLLVMYCAKRNGYLLHHEAEWIDIPEKQHPNWYPVKDLVA